MKRVPPKFWILVGFVLVFGTAATLGVVFGKSGLHSSPTEIRQEAQRTKWEPAMKPPAPSTPAGERPFPTPQLSIERKEEELIIKAVSPELEEVNPAISVYEAGSSLEYEVPNGPVIRLLAVATLWPDKELVESDKTSVPVDYLHPLTHEPIKSFSEEAKRNVRSFRRNYEQWRTEPVAIFLMESSEDENFRWHGIQIFNSITHSKLNSGYSYHHSRISPMKTTTHAWHNPPLAVVVDFAYGPPLVKQLPLRENAIVSFSEFDMHFHRLVDGPWTMRSYSFGDEAVWRYQLAPKYKRSYLGITSVIPEEYETRVSFHIEDEKASLQTQDGVAVWTTKAEIDDPTIEVRYLPNYGRVVFQIPSLPGAPNRYDELSNLFDTKIPYVSTDRTYEIRQIIETTTELRLSVSSYSPLSSPDPHFTFENITVGELLKIYAHSENLPPLRVDPSNHTIVERQLFWDRLRSWFP